MLLSPSQIRAARALLDWSQDDLAQASGLARPTIVNIESGKQKPGTKTIEYFLEVFQREGIQFTADDGVRKQKNFVRVFKGEEEGYEYFDFVLEHSQRTLSPVYMNNVDTSSYERCLPNFFSSNYVRGMSKLGEKIDVRLIACEGDYRQPVKAYAEYRWVPKDKFNSSVPIYIFGDYIAIIMFLDDVSIFLIKDKNAADTYREKFLEQWESAMPIPKKS